MAVINVGTARRRTDPFGLNDVGAVWEQKRSNRAQEALSADILKQRESERKTREKVSENRLSSDLASQELRKSEMNIKNVKATHDRFSMWWNGMKPQERAIAKTSDQYKEMQKFFKGFKSIAPGLINDQGDIVSANSKDIFKEKLEEQVAKAKLNLANGNASKGDVNLLQITEATKDDMSSVLAEAVKELSVDDIKNPNIFSQWLKGAILKLQHGKRRSQTMQEGLATTQPGVVTPQTAISPNTNALAPEGNQADPLGILGR